MKQAYDLRFNTRRPIDPETRRILKDAIGDLVRTILDSDEPVSINAFESGYGQAFSHQSRGTSCHTVGVICGADASPP